MIGAERAVPDTIVILGVLAAVAYFAWVLAPRARGWLRAARSFLAAGWRLVTVGFAQLNLRRRQFIDKTLQTKETGS